MSGGGAAPSRLAPTPGPSAVVAAPPLVARPLAGEEAAHDGAALRLSMSPAVYAITSPYPLQTVAESAARLQHWAHTQLRCFPSLVTAAPETESQYQLNLPGGLAVAIAHDSGGRVSHIVATLDADVQVYRVLAEMEAAVGQALRAGQPISIHHGEAGIAWRIAAIAISSIDGWLTIPHHPVPCSARLPLLW
jgi:hypothetical protein